MMYARTNCCTAWFVWTVLLLLLPDPGSVSLLLVFFVGIFWINCILPSPTTYVATCLSCPSCSRARASSLLSIPLPTYVVLIRPPRSETYLISIYSTRSILLVRGLEPLEL